MKLITNILAAATAENDCDKAVRIVMDALGITEGDCAGVHFDTETWAKYGRHDRAIELGAWLQSELVMAAEAPSPTVPLLTAPVYSVARQLFNLYDLFMDTDGGDNKDDPEFVATRAKLESVGCHPDNGFPGDVTDDTVIIIRDEAGTETSRCALHEFFTSNHEGVSFRALRDALNERKTFKSGGGAEAFFSVERA